MLREESTCRVNLERALGSSKEEMESLISSFTDLANAMKANNALVGDYSQVIAQQKHQITELEENLSDAQFKATEADFARVKMAEEHKEMTVNLRFVLVDVIFP